MGWDTLKKKLGVGSLIFCLGGLTAVSLVRERRGPTEVEVIGTARVQAEGAAHTCGDLRAAHARALEEAITDARAKAALLGSGLRVCGVRELDCRVERDGEGEAPLFAECRAAVRFVRRTLLR